MSGKSFPIGWDRSTASPANSHHLHPSSRRSARAALQCHAALRSGSETSISRCQYSLRRISCTEDARPSKNQQTGRRTFFPKTELQHGREKVNQLRQSTEQQILDYECPTLDSVLIQTANGHNRPEQRQHHGKTLRNASSQLHATRRSTVVWIAPANPITNKNEWKTNGLTCRWVTLPVRIVETECNSKPIRRACTKRA